MNAFKDEAISLKYINVWLFQFETWQSEISSTHIKISNFQ